MDTVVLTHIKHQSRLSLVSFGGPTMTKELKEVGVNAGHQRVVRLLRENSPLDCFVILLTFFKTIKAELVWRRFWETRRWVETAFGQSLGPMAVMPLLQYIYGFCNPRHRHSALGGKSPLAFDRQVAQTSGRAAQISGRAINDRSAAFGDAKMTTALLDRLTHRCHIVDTGNDRFRFRVGSAGAKTKKGPTQVLTRGIIRRPLV